MRNLTGAHATSLIATVPTMETLSAENHSHIKDESCLLCKLILSSASDKRVTNIKGVEERMGVREDESCL